MYPPCVCAHQVQFVFVLCVVFKCVYLSVQAKKVEHVLHALVVWHVPYKQLYLGGVWLRGLPATSRGREGGAIPRDLVDGADALGLGEAWGDGGGGAG